MKKCTILTRLLAVVALWACAPTAGAQVDDLYFPEFIRDEATYRYQQYIVPRSTLDKPVTLRQQLDQLLEDHTYHKAYVVQSHLGGMEYSVYRNVDELLDQDPVFLSYNLEEGKLSRKQFEMNTSVYLNFKDEYGKERCLIIHYRPRGFLDKSVYSRTSLMLPAYHQEDDYRSFNSNSSPILASYLTAFDVTDRTADMTQFKAVEESAVKKYNNRENLTDTETDCIAGINGEPNFASNHSYGNWLFRNNRYYDAYITLYPNFEMLKPIATPKQENIRQLLAEQSHQLGICAWKLGFHDTADFYLGLAAHEDESYRADYSTFVESRPYEATLNPENPSAALSVGQVLSILLDAREGHVTEGVCAIDGEYAKLDTPAEAWNFDLRKLCTDGPGNLTLAYSRTHRQNSPNDTVDKSKLCYDNNIIISSVKADDKRWRINVMVPNFRNSDYKQPRMKHHVPQGASFIIGSEETVLGGKRKRTYKALSADLEAAHRLHAEKRIMEALVLLMQMNHEIQAQPEKKRQEAKMKDLHAQVLYHIGFNLAELQQSKKAIPYLGKSLELKEATETRREYIANLSNTTDPRAFDMIKASLEQPLQDKKFENFLNRRYAYMLIEYERLDEAEAVLRKLLEDPDSESFARGELEYIQSLRKPE